MRDGGKKPDQLLTSTFHWLNTPQAVLFSQKGDCLFFLQVFSFLFLQVCASEKSDFGKKISDIRKNAAQSRENPQSVVSEDGHGCKKKSNIIDAIRLYLASCTDFIFGYNICILISIREKNPLLILGGASLKEVQYGKNTRKVKK
ncbi:MAG: hypothetical protein KQH59_20820 [Desulfobulbaceae bacterium]|nr:hypothetical protein [Desulfobulbaceae bacterium]